MSYRHIFKPYIKEKKEGKTHALLSASGSERWLGCPGSIRLTKDLPQVDNEWSVAGTNAHTLMQFILENPYQWKLLLESKDAKKFKEHIGYSDEQLEAVLVATEYVWQEHARMKDETGRDPELHIEKKVHLSGVGHGTADIIMFQPFGLLHVMDYKNGRSVVHPEENTQALYYAHAAADEYGWDFEELWITIIQPNASHSRGPIRTWKTTLKRLEKAGHVFIRGAKKTKMKDAPLVVNPKWCWFCNARGVCPAQIKLKRAETLDRFKREK